MPDSRRQLPALDLATLRDRTLASLQGKVAPAGLVDNDPLWGRLHAHYTLLRRWTPAVGLIGRGSAADTPQRHYGESLAGLRFLGQGPCLDIGSGAGFPGLILAACRPEQDVVLVESRQRKAAFLRHAARAMGLSHCRIVAARWGDTDASLDIAVRALRPFAALTARAVDLGPWLDSLDSALATNAVWLAWGEGAEPRNLGADWQQSEAVTFAGDRALTVYRRVTRERSAPA